MIHHQNSVTQPTFGDVLCAYHAFVKLKGSNKVARSSPPIEVPQVRILVADSGLIQCQLLARALRARRNFQISTVSLEASALHQFMDQ